MGILKRCMAFVVILAFVFMTTMPGQSHASMNDHQHTQITKAEKTQSSDHEDCHHEQAQTSVKKSDHPNKSEGSCCDKVCKCMGGACGSFGKALSESDFSTFSPPFVKTHFVVSSAVHTSYLTNGLRRPPRT